MALDSVSCYVGLAYGVSRGVRVGFLGDTCVHWGYADGQLVYIGVLVVRLRRRQ